MQDFALRIFYLLKVCHVEFSGDQLAVILFGSSPPPFLWPLVEILQVGIPSKVTDHFQSSFLTGWMKVFLANQASATTRLEIDRRTPEHSTMAEAYPSARLCLEIGRASCRERVCQYV